MKKNYQPVNKIVLGLVFLLALLMIGKVLTASVYSQAVCNPKCLTEDPCCAQMVEQQDYSLCEWADPRGFCQPQTCDKLPPGVAGRGHCGWYWFFHDAAGGTIGTNTPQGYGCMIGASETSMRPICGGGSSSGGSSSGGPPPTQIPKPTPKPTAKPTRVPTQPVHPTQPPQPTDVKSPTEPPQPTTPLGFPTHLYPTQEPLVQQNNTTDYGFVNQGFDQGNNRTNTGWNYNPRPFQSGISFNLPSIHLPVLRLTGLLINVEKANQQVSRSLDFFEYVFFKVKFYDMKLERNINNSFMRLLQH